MKIITSTLLCFCLVSTTLGFEVYLQRLPNHDKIKQSDGRQHSIGHINPNGDGSRNQFGKDFDAAGQSWTPALCMADSDGDGLSNGFELGDPECVWVRGSTPSRTVDITNPGVCEVGRCNGTSTQNTNGTMSDSDSDSDSSESDGADTSEETDEEEDGEMNEETEATEVEMASNENNDTAASDAQNTNDNTNNNNNPSASVVQGQTSNTVNVQPNVLNAREPIQSESLVFDIENSGRSYNVASELVLVVILNIICKYLIK